MKYLAIDLRSNKAQKFFDFINSLSLPFVKEIDIPNDTTIKTINEVRQSKTTKAKNTSDLSLKHNTSITAKKEHEELKSFVLLRKNPAFAKHL